MSCLVLSVIAFLLLNATSAIADGIKIDCHPLEGANKDACESRGCIWAPVYKQVKRPSNAEKLPFDEDLTAKLAAKYRPPRSEVKEPWCYFPSNYVGYEVVKAEPYVAYLTRKNSSGVPGDVQKLVVKMSFQTNIDETPMRIKIYDPTKQRFEPEIPELQETGFTSNLALLTATLSEDGNLVVIRKSTGTVVFKTDLTKLIFADKFIQLNAKINSPYVYGLGEHYDTFLKMADDYKVYSMFHYDQTPMPGGRRSYGSFPFYINLDSNLKHAHGVYLRNSNAMDVIIQPDLSITFRTVGGILDFYIYPGPKPYDVAREFQNHVGRPALPPRWTLGFHLCRYDYKTLEKTKLVSDRTRAAGIPFDVQWNDIDYMENHDDFTYDPVKFAGLPEYINDLHKNDMHYMLIFDPGLSQDKNYYPYNLGTEMNIFVKNASNKPLIGKVWNDSGRTVFPDFSNPLSKNFWIDLFTRFHQQVPFDGAWNDMNDISNFVDGSLDGCPEENDLENPPYRPGGTKLNEKTLCMSAKHMAGSEYNLHNLYGFYEAIATWKALEAVKPGTRPFIVSRSTTVGQGKYSHHWSGDVASSWDYLKWSIPSLLEHSMYGYSMMGTDICGFSGDTTVELCARWSTLGAFYTFTRNHNDDKSIDQDPVALGPTVVEANRNALTKKYSLLPYLYSLIYNAHLQASPIIRSVPLEFSSTDPETLNIEYQFMWGDGIMISPIVEPNTFSKKTYLPEGRWYEFDVLISRNSLKVPKLIDSTGGWHTTENIALTDIALFYRGGRIFPTYSRVSQTTTETAKQPYSLEVALCQKGMAKGELFDDDGENIEEKYNHLTMVFEEQSLKIEMDKDDHSSNTKFSQFLIYGVSFEFNKVEIEGKNISFVRHEHTVLFDLLDRKVSKTRPLVVKFV